ncbi:hypothetical protein [Actinomadura sp. 6N118]|uniref:hypothetical protein n=1 Tax=Actinomadura sp. 6N118 TaxID=3375151 RepID=UPI0037B2C632
MGQMSIVSRTAVIGGLSLTLAMGAVPAMAAVSDGHANAVQIAKPQKYYAFGVRVTSYTGPRSGRAIPKHNKLLTKTNVGANISIEASGVQGAPMRVQLFAKGGRPLGRVVTVRARDKGKIKLNTAKVKKGTKFYLLFKSSSRTRGSIMSGSRVYY